MSEKNIHMKPIWYFVGLILLSMGFIVLLTGLYILFVSKEAHTVLGELHPNVWWGAIMMIVGATFFFLHRNKGTH
ncbi:MAG: hypothetical protein WBW16_08565 [Bacteroidota bacterium]